VFGDAGRHDEEHDGYQEDRDDGEKSRKARYEEIEGLIEDHEGENSRSIRCGLHASRIQLGAFSLW
jgi:hypothetical protein